MVHLIIVTHGEFGAYLVEAAEEIVGRQGEGVRAVSISPRWSLSEARRRVAKAIQEQNGHDGLIVAVDIPGGTPANIVVPLVKDMSRVRVVSGVNLYMLISAFTRRNQSDIDELARRMIADGQKSVRDIKALLAAPCR